MKQTPFNEHAGMFSPDGRFLAYTSNESGTLEVYVRSFKNESGKWPISNEGGRQPVWARNGRELFYRDDGKMMAVPIETEPVFLAGRPTELFEDRFALAESLIAQYDVAPDGERFVMLKDSESTWPTEIHVVLNWFEDLKARVPPATH